MADFAEPGDGSTSVNASQRQNDSLATVSDEVFDPFTLFPPDVHTSQEEAEELRRLHLERDLQFRHAKALMNEWMSIDTLLPRVPRIPALQWSNPALEESVTVRALDPINNLGVLSLLPPELRGRIFEFALREDYSCLLPDCKCNKFLRSANSGLQLLATCKQIYAEAIPILYRDGLFTLVCGTITIFDDNTEDSSPLDYYGYERDDAARIRWHDPELYCSSQSMGRFKIGRAPPNLFDLVQRWELILRCCMPTPNSRTGMPFQRIDKDVWIGRILKNLTFHAEYICELLRNKPTSIRYLSVEIDLEELGSNVEEIVPLLEPFKTLRGIGEVEVMVNVKFCDAMFGNGLNIDFDSVPREQIRYELSDDYRKLLENIMTSPSGTVPPDHDHLPIFVDYMEDVEAEDARQAEVARDMEVLQDDWIDSAEDEDEDDDEGDEYILSSNANDKATSNMIEYLKDIYGTEDVTALYGTDMKPIWRLWLDGEHEPDCAWDEAPSLDPQLEDAPDLDPQWEELLYGMSVGENGEVLNGAVATEDGELTEDNGGVVTASDEIIDDNGGIIFDSAADGPGVVIGSDAIENDEDDSGPGRGLDLDEESH